MNKLLEDIKKYGSPVYKIVNGQLIRGLWYGDLNYVWEDGKEYIFKYDETELDLQ